MNQSVVTRSGSVVLLQSVTIWLDQQLNYFLEFHCSSSVLQKKSLLTRVIIHCLSNCYLPIKIIYWSVDFYLETTVNKSSSNTSPGRRDNERNGKKVLSFHNDKVSPSRNSTFFCSVGESRRNSRRIEYRSFSYCTLRTIGTLPSDSLSGPLLPSFENTSSFNGYIQTKYVHKVSPI